MFLLMLVIPNLYCNLDCIQTLVISRRIGLFLFNFNDGIINVCFAHVTENVVAVMKVVQATTRKEFPQLEAIVQLLTV